MATIWMQMLVGEGGGRRKGSFRSWDVASKNYAHELKVFLILTPQRVNLFAVI